MSEQSTVIAVTDTSFEADVLQASIPVLVDFWGRMVWPMQNDRTHFR